MSRGGYPPAMTNPTILAFDTSGPFCSVALWRGRTVVSEAYAEMARGQAEALMPMIADLMAEAGIGRRHLTGIGVGIGPGNFTGLRISVAAARGLSLALGIPAIGISSFEVLLADAPGDGDETLLSLPAPRDQVYLHQSDGAALTGKGWQADPKTPGVTAPRVIGAKAETLARAMGGAKTEARSLPRTAPIIARLAAARLAAGGTHPRPAPLYIRAADAAPSKHAAPARLS